MEKIDVPILSFASPKLWRDWLEKNHEISHGVWVEFFKKGSGIPTITYAEALDEALCFGWIDSQVKGKDEKSYLQKFTPRRTKSPWSQINRQHIARLIKEGRMHKSGLAQVEAAKKDGRWEAAYPSPKDMHVPEDFIALLKKNKKAYEFYLTLHRTNTYVIAFQLHTAKQPETRERRIKKFIAMFEKGEKLY